MLGAVLLGIIVLFVSCSGDDQNDPRGKGPSSASPTTAPASGAAGVEPSFLDDVPGGSGPSLPAPGDIDPGAAGDDDDEELGASALPTIGGAANGQNTNVTGPAGGTCADTEIALTPTPATSTIKRGAALVIGLTIKNIGSRTCSRDVGADPQELYLEQGASQYWSSDTCSKDKRSNVRQLVAGEVLTFKVTWNGRQSSSCSGSLSAGPNPPPGQFELRARLGTLVSAPAPLTIAA